MNNNKKKKRIGFSGKLASYFLDNKQLGILTVFVLLSWGILSFFIMPKQYNPEIVAPAFNITTEFLNANSNEVYELVTRPMEAKVKELPKVDKVSSRSIDGGLSVISVQFYVGEDVEEAKIALTQKLQSNMELRPIGVKDPEIKEVNPDNVPILVLALTSDVYSEESLRKIAWDLGDRLNRIEGTSRIEVKGGGRKQLSVRLDIDKLTAYKISVEEVIIAIKNNNLRSYAGDIENNSTRFRVFVDANIKSLEDLRKIVVSNQGDSLIYLSDIAQLDYDLGEIEKFVRFSERENSSPAVYLSIAKSKGQNAMSVSADVLNKLEAVRTEIIPNNVEIEIVRNSGKISNEAVMSLTKNLFIAIFIVSFLLFLFLGWRSALVVALAIPLTLVSVFAIGNLFGQTINRITLFALILSLGLLVDNATVVVENIHRMLRKHPEKKKKEIIIEAVDEVGPGLVMSTVTTIFAFVPMAFVTGMMGPYMGPIPFFIPVALVISLLIAFTINPFFLNLLTLEKPQSKIRKDVLSESESNSFFLKLMNKMKDYYSQFLRKVLDNKQLQKSIIIIVSILFLMAISLPVLTVVKFRMLPKADKEQFYIYLDLPEHASVEKTNEISRKVEKFILNWNDEIKSVQSFVGESQIVDFNGLFKGSDARTKKNQATLKVNLTHLEVRQISSEDIVLKIRPELEEELHQFPDLRVKLIEDPPGPPVLSTFLIKVQGENIEELERIARDIEQEAFNINEVVDVDSTINERTFEYALEVDKEKANLSGLDAQAIVTTVRSVLKGTKVGLYHQISKDERKPEQEYIVVKFEKEDRNEKMDLDKIFISNKEGEKIPLSEIVSWSQSSVVPTIYSDEQIKTVYISAEMGDRSVTYGMIDAFLFLVDYKLPSENGEMKKWSLFGFEYQDVQTNQNYKIVLDGEWKLTLDVFRDLGIAMAVAVFLIYFVLVAQSRSLKTPLLVMGTILLAMIGIMPGFALLGFTKGIFFNATSMIGVIALSGIVVNNAIIFLEYLNELKEKGRPIKEAIVETGETRFLPIVLTSMTTILGSLTIISDPVWAGLAWAIFWGLSISSVLTLVIFPLFYYIFERKDWQ